MSVVLDAEPSRGSVGFEWLPVVAGLLILYVPTFYDLASTDWKQDDLAHGPIILAVIVWLIWDKRQVLLAAPTRAAPIPGIALLVFGLLLYIVGRSKEVMIFEVGALAPILAGVLLAMRGWPALRAMWFMLLLYCVPGAAAAFLRGRDDVAAETKRFRDCGPDPPHRWLSDRAQWRHTYHRAIPVAGGRRLLRPQLDVQPFCSRAAVPLPDAPPRAGCTMA